MNKKHRKQLDNTPEQDAQPLAAEQDAQPETGESIEDKLAAALTRALNKYMPETAPVQKPFDGRFDVDKPAVQPPHRSHRADDERGLGFSIDAMLDGTLEKKPLKPQPAEPKPTAEPPKSLTISEQAHWQRMPEPEVAPEPERGPAPQPEAAPEPEQIRLPDWDSKLSDGGAFDIVRTGESSVPEQPTYSVGREAVREEIFRAAGIEPRGNAPEPEAEFLLSGATPHAEELPKSEALSLSKTQLSAMQGNPQTPATTPVPTPTTTPTEPTKRELRAQKKQAKAEAKLARKRVKQALRNQPTDVPQVSNVLPEVTTQSEPEVHESRPEPEAHESQPEPEMHESQPEPEVHESQLESEMHKSQPESEMHESRPEPEVHESQPEPEMHESRPEPAEIISTEAAASLAPELASVPDEPPMPRVPDDVSAPQAQPENFWEMIDGLKDVIGKTPLKPSKTPDEALSADGPTKSLPVKEVVNALRKQPDRPTKALPVKEVANMLHSQPAEPTKALPVKEIANALHSQPAEPTKALPVKEIANALHTQRNTSAATQDTVRFTPLRDTENANEAAPQAPTDAAQKEDFWSMLDGLKDVLGEAAPTPSDAPATDRQPAPEEPQPATDASGFSADDVAPDSPTEDAAADFLPPEGGAAPLAGAAAVAFGVMAVRTKKRKSVTPPAVPTQKPPKRKKPTPPEQTDELPDELPEQADAQSEPAALPKRVKKPAKPTAPLLTPDDAHRSYGKLLGSSGARLVIVGFLCLIGILLSVYFNSGWHFLPQLLTQQFSSYLLAVLLLACMLLCYDVLADGLLGLLRLRLNQNSLLLLLSGTVFADAIYAASHTRLPLCAAACVLLFFGLWAKFDRCTGMLTTLKVVCGLKNPIGVFEVQDFMKGNRGLARSGGSAEDFMRNVDAQVSSDRAMRVYTPIATVLCIAAAVVISVKTGSFFLWTLSLLFIGAMPLFGLIGYARLFCLLAKRLEKAGAALCGWYGAEVFSGRHTILLCDDDLFPQKDVTFNGIKVYRGDMDRLVSYAAAASSAANCALAAQFEELLESHNARRTTATRYRYYESGGIGAEISHDIVLLGTLDFMRHMGVHMDASIRVKQALYLSVNGELAAVFAIKYQMTDSTQRGLVAISSNRHFTPVLATRDFLITPDFLSKYLVPTGNLYYPDVKERLRLSQTELKKSGGQGALLERDSFGAFAEAAAGGHALHSAGILSTLMAILSGAIGIGLMAVLAFTGATDAATPTNVLLYLLGWSIPTLLMSGWTRRG